MKTKTSQSLPPDAKSMLQAIKCNFFVDTKFFSVNGRKPDLPGVTQTYGRNHMVTTQEVRSQPKKYGQNLR